LTKAVFGYTYFNLFTGINICDSWNYLRALMKTTFDIFIDHRLFLSHFHKFFVITYS
jgi:hypothetical protein